MARRDEAGISYFPMNSDIVHNPKIKLVVAEFGPKAWAVLLPLYCKIYREKGYWVDWLDADLKLMFAQDECRVDLTFVNEVVAGCVRRGVFNKTVFDTFGILTSDRIQLNYLEAKKRNKSVDLIAEYLVVQHDVYINLKNVNILSQNVNIKEENVNISTQKEIIEGEGEGEEEVFTRSAVFSKEEIQNSNLFRKPKIPDKKEVWEVFSGHGGTKEMAKAFYEKYESVGWFKSGSPITNFSNLVPSFITNWLRNEKHKPAAHISAPPLKNASDV